MIAALKSYAPDSSLNLESSCNEVHVLKTYAWWQIPRQNHWVNEVQNWAWSPMRCARVSNELPVSGPWSFSLGLRLTSHWILMATIADCVIFAATEAKEIDRYHAWLVTFIVRSHVRHLRRNFNVLRKAAMLWQIPGSFFLERSLVQSVTLLVGWRTVEEGALTNALNPIWNLYHFQGQGIFSAVQSSSSILEGWYSAKRGSLQETDATISWKRDGFQGFAVERHRQLSKYWYFPQRVTAASPAISITIQAKMIAMGYVAKGSRISVTPSGIRNSKSCSSPSRYMIFHSLKCIFPKNDINPRFTGMHKSFKSSWSCITRPSSRSCMVNTHLDEHGCEVSTCKAVTRSVPSTWKLSPFIQRTSKNSIRKDSLWRNDQLSGAVQTLISGYTHLMTCSGFSLFDSYDCFHRGDKEISIHPAYYVDESACEHTR